MQTTSTMESLCHMRTMSGTQDQRLPSQCEVRCLCISTILNCPLAVCTIPSHLHRQYTHHPCTSRLHAITHLNVRYVVSHLRCLHATTTDDSPQSFQTPAAVPQPFQRQRQPPLPSKTTVTPMLSHNGDHPHHLPASTPAPPSAVLIPQPLRWRQLT